MIIHYRDDVQVMEVAHEIAEEAVAAFSQLHPTIRMNYDQWGELREMIEREVVGHFTSSEISAVDLLGGEAA